MVAALKIGSMHNRVCTTYRRVEKKQVIKTYKLKEENNKEKYQKIISDLIEKQGRSVTTNVEWEACNNILQKTVKIICGTINVKSKR